jgi:hypothetical protein
MTCCRGPHPDKPRPCRLHGCERAGRRAPCGPANGMWRHGRFSRALSPEQRAAAWADYRAANECPRPRQLLS